MIVNSINEWISCKSVVKLRIFLLCLNTGLLYSTSPHLISLFVNLENSSLLSILSCSRSIAREMGNQLVA